MKVKIRIIRKFEDRLNNQLYLPGQIFSSPIEFARRYVSRGDAEFVEGEDVNITGGMIKHPKVSIVILIKDALKYVKECIKSLNRYTSNFELILVDNGSNEETKEWLSGLDWLDYKLIINKENKGFSYGNNQAIKIAKYDYICFLNSDTLLSPNWLGKLMRGFDYSKDVGIVGPSTCDCATIQSPQAWKSFKNAGQEEVNRISTMFQEDYIEHMVVGFCFVIKKEVFEKIGVFDHKRYGIACHEDIDLVWRANKTGFKSLWCQASYVHHYGNRTTKEMGLDPKEIRKKNRPVFLERVNDKNLYIKNDAVIKEVKEVKGKIPILMITWNRFEYTKKSIEAVLSYTDLPFKLFIYDNNSTDGTKKYLNNLKDERVEIYFSRKNTGLVPPMNYFFNKFANHRYVAKVDNDTIVSKNWMSKLKTVLDEFPLLAVEADHYLMLGYNIKNNNDYYKNLFSIDFNGSRLYFSDIVGGTGTLIRNAAIDEIPEYEGTLSGWIQYQHYKQMPSAFYSGVWIDRLDQVGTNKYKEPSDYPDYDKRINKLRPRKKIGARTIRKDMFIDVFKRMENWYENL